MTIHRLARQYALLNCPFITTHRFQSDNRIRGASKPLDQVFMVSAGVLEGHAFAADAAKLMEIELAYINTNKARLACHNRTFFLMLRGHTPQPTVRV